MRALIDTGSAYIALRPEIIAEPGLYETPYEVELTLADSRKIRSRPYVAEAWCRDRRDPVFIVGANIPPHFSVLILLKPLGLAEPGCRGCGGNRLRGVISVVGRL